MGEISLAPWLSFTHPNPSGKGEGVGPACMAWLYASVGLVVRCEAQRSLEPGGRGTAASGHAPVVRGFARARHLTMRATGETARATGAASRTNTNDMLEWCLMRGRVGV